MAFRIKGLPVPWDVRELRELAPRVHVREGRFRGLGLALFMCVGL
jgi:hypothetical protein